MPKRKSFYRPGDKSYNAQPSTDHICWKINFLGGELKAVYYGRVEPSKVYRNPAQAARRMRSGASYICVHFSIAEETIRLIDGRNLLPI